MVSVGEILVALIAVVATWRSVERDRAGAGRYGFFAIGLALIFVGVQAVLTVLWTGWAALAGLGLAPSPGLAVLDQLLRYSSAVFG